MLRAAARKGYPEATVGDIVEEAKVSRRTFYEQFANKEECLLAAYEAASVRVLRQVASAIDRRRTWEDNVCAVVDAYLAGITADPAVSKVILIEIAGAGPRALALRRRAYRQWAATLTRPGVRPSLELRQAVIAAVNERVLIAVEQERIDLPVLRKDIIDLIVSAMSVPVGTDA
ncbi:TetR/AcrR family transcriptional regulator [Amycolatopsis nigrescens]|uniref:TetR/AcrR family transcriptional regulator n=1 Tax=Amycolatopsis nigrescens TaxID=381445 RepID=UPI0007C5C809|nr:TetR/AcrR family transcriptional regulator [Amycolatopsis nigrescens]